MDDNNRFMIADLPESERPRERLRQVPITALSHRELLAILLRHGTQGKSALDLAAELLWNFNSSLLGLAGATVSQLCSIKGVGEVKAMELQAAFELARRMAEERLHEMPLLNNPQLIACYIQNILLHRRQEEFHALLLDVKMRLVRDVTVTVGLLDRCPVHPREVFRLAVMEGCAGVVVCHNHPSGDPSPSKQDIMVTKILQDAGKILGIYLQDHVIVAGGAAGSPNFFSFRLNGMLDDEEKTEREKTPVKRNSARKNVD